MMTSWAWSWDGGPAFAVHATLGSVIAHEILHAFDFHQRRLPSVEPDRNIDEWLRVTPDSWKRLETRIECVARLYARSFWRRVQSYGNDVAVQVSPRVFRAREDDARDSLIKIRGNNSFLSLLILSYIVRLEHDEEREHRGHRCSANCPQDLAHFDEREGSEPSRIGGTSSESALLHKCRTGNKSNKITRVSKDKTYFLSYYCLSTPF